MIFITVGTEKFSFDRLIRIIDNAINDGIIESECFAQIGESNYIPKRIQYKKFLEFKIFLEYIKKSELIITHAGVGTLLNCLNLGKIPIIFPRLYKYKEHLDNHQLELANALEKEEAVVVAHNEKELIYKIKNYNQLIRDLKRYSNGSSKNELINYLNNVVASKLK